jgi:hypothetical protein
VHPDGGHAVEGHPVDRALHPAEERESWWRGPREGEVYASRTPLFLATQSFVTSVNELIQR